MLCKKVWEVGKYYAKRKVHCVLEYFIIVVIVQLKFIPIKRLVQ